ncbi:MAG: zinc ribbon domain-containing protein, partial [Desulfobacteraceae bacterium]
MFCSKCGEKNPDDGKFCSKCGTALTATKAPAAAPAKRAAAGEKTSGIAIAALVMGIAAFVVFGPLA